jgi:hypothetical protein
MGNPYDPSTPLYEGQQAQPQQAQQAPQVQPGNSQASTLHFLGGLGELAMAGVHFFAGGSDDEDEGEEEAAAPRRFRPRLFGANSSKRVGKGSCCRRPVGR